MPVSRQDAATDWIIEASCRLTNLSAGSALPVDHSPRKRSILEMAESISWVTGILKSNDTYKSTYKYPYPRVDLGGLMLHADPVYSNLPAPSGQLTDPYYYNCPPEGSAYTLQQTRENYGQPIEKGPDR